MQKKIKNFGQTQLRNLLVSLGEIYREPLSNFIVISVIATTCILPIFGFSILKNLEEALSYWQKNFTIAIYLKDNLTIKQRKNLENTLLAQPQINSVEFISKDTALKELIDAHHSFATMLEHNPLPDLFSAHINTEMMIDYKLLEQELTQIDNIANVEADIKTLKALEKITHSAQIIFKIISTLLLASIFLIIANTIRLIMEIKKAEIHLNKLMGATSWFVQSEFMYYGFWYAFLGSSCAVIASKVIFAAFKPTFVNSMLMLNENFNITSLSATQSIAIVLSISFMALTSTCIAIYYRLHKLDI